MKKYEKAHGIIAILAIILNLSNVPYGGVLTALTLTILSLIYLFFGVVLLNEIRLKEILKKDSYKNLSGLRIFGTILVGMSFSFITMGFMFKLQGYPYAYIILENGLISIAIAFIVGLFKFLKSKSRFYTNILIRITIIGLFGLAVLYTPRERILEIRHRNHPEYVEAVKKAWADPENMELWKKVEEESLKMQHK